MAVSRHVGFDQTGNSASVCDDALMKPTVIRNVFQAHLKELLDYI